MPARALNDYLKRQREETIGTSKEVRQADITLALRVSQPLISPRSGVRITPGAPVVSPPTHFEWGEFW